MDYSNENNELFNESSGSIDSPDDNYNRVLADLGISTPKDDMPIQLEINKFGLFSLSCNSVTQVRKIRKKMILKGFIPLSADSRPDRNGTIYILYFSVHSRFPEVRLN